MHILSFLFRLRADVSSLVVDTSLPTSEVITDSVALVPRTVIPLLRVALRDHVRPAKCAERVDYGSAPSAWRQEQG